MSDLIKLLPDSVANQIAAGEVIQRPASVIKELVENAVDAGATSIQIILKDAGRTLIQVVDNGKGMSVTDARMAFERHATSKITNAADLFALHTMGFRGEALASIAAIAHVDMRTMRKDDSIGTRIILNGSAVESQEPDACAPGTNMMVKDLFFNVPARRKFLKKDSVELSHILHEFERLTLVNTNVEFTIIHNDVVLHQFQKGNLKQRIVALFGKSLDAQLIPVETETSLVKLSGFVGLPSHGRRRNALQYFFVNGRNMRHPYFHKAVMLCYEQLMPADMQPNYFLNFEVDPASIDVNIHPTKSEIKFENEQPIWQILVAAIKESLGKYNAGPAIDFDVTDMPDIPVFDPNGLASHHVEIDHSYNPFASAPANETIIPSSSSPTTSGYNRNYHKPSASDMEQILPPVESFTEPSAMSHGSVAQPLPIENTGSSEAAGSIMQLKGRYILSGARNGLRIIDQHRAHITILYDRYLSMVDNGEMAVQRLIFPESITLSASQQPIMESMVDELGAAGFDMAYLGNNTWSINGMPAVIDKLNPVETITSLVDYVAETNQQATDTIQSRIALAMARASAVKPGQSLTVAEMDALMLDLLCLPAPGFTPDGLPVLTIVDMDTIAGML